jgi:hypothetical protein
MHWKPPWVANNDELLASSRASALSSQVAQTAAGRHLDLPTQDGIAATTMDDRHRAAGIDGLPTCLFKPWVQPDSPEWGDPPAQLAPRATAANAIIALGYWLAGTSVPQLAQVRAGAPCHFTAD